MTFTNIPHAISVIRNFRAKLAAFPVAQHRAFLEREASLDLFGPNELAIVVTLAGSMGVVEAVDAALRQLGYEEPQHD